jgi:hypothetical protein
MTLLGTAVFMATIPPIMSGIKTGGDGMRVQFDIDESNIGEAVKLIGMRGELLEVTVRVRARDGKGNDSDVWDNVG